MQPREWERAKSVFKGELLCSTVQSKRDKKGSDDTKTEKKLRSVEQDEIDEPWELG